MVPPIRPIRRSQYRLLGLAGHGQFGRVYCAIHRRTGELVAIKDLHKDRFPTHKFLRELRFLLSLEHPNIVTCHALEHSTSGRQLILDYCEGGTLRSLMESDTCLTLMEILSFLADILGALEQAHQQGIVHCDIKPENILLQLTPGGWTARISDFGIARLSQEAKSLEMGQTGSPAYMAPERFYNQHPAQSDLYAVGIVFYELLVGHRPFSGTPMELMVAHLNALPSMPDQMPPPLASFGLKSLEKLLPRRFKTAGEMQRALLLLAQQVRAGKLETGPLPPRSRPPEVETSPLPAVPFPHGIEVLGLVSLTTQTQLLLACSQGQVWFYHYSKGTFKPPGPTQSFTLADPVRRFIPLPQGGVLVTDTALHLLSMAHGLGRIAYAPEGSLGTAIAPSGRWFATCPRQPGKRGLSLLIQQLRVDLGGSVKISAPRSVPLPDPTGAMVSLLALDDRHVALVMRQERSTRFYVATRRGTYVGSLAVQVPLHSLVATAHPYRYLALEVGYPNSLMVVDFKPFKVVRYRLDMAPHWLFETAVGYGLVSADGRFCLVNHEGQVLNRLTGLPQPTAMVPLSSTQYLWSVATAQGSQLCTFDLAQVGLDLLF